MLLFLREGGVGMVIMIVWGACAFAVALAFALKPSSRKQGFLHGMALAISMLAVASTAMGLNATTKAAAMCREMGTTCTHASQDILVEGFGESIANLAVGGVILAFVALVYAVGRLRMAAPA